MSEELRFLEAQLEQCLDRIRIMDEKGQQFSIAMHYHCGLERGLRMAVEVLQGTYQPAGPWTAGAEVWDE